MGAREEKAGEKVRNHSAWQVTVMNHIARSVKQIVEEFGTNDPYRLARMMGIDIDEFPFRRVRGLILDIAGKVTIVLNSNLPEWLKRFVLAHEIGHRLLSPQGTGYFFLAEHTLMDTDVECEANRFAVELLTWGEQPEQDETLEHFAARVGMPAEMMRYKAI